ncbi:MAG TPA: dihydrolipoamide acetyltransferase family protein [Polyangia bacterium]|nr:dihydrolipoamide acetyltransferase family protein [Polyangia bacterium]
MTYEFKLPDIGEGVVEGEVVRWLVKEGDELREDQPMVEIMTDKATVEIPAPRAGRVGKRMFSEGQLCPVGQVLITIELGGAAAASTEPAGVTVATAEGVVAAKAPASATPAASRGNGRGVGGPAGSILATPATRKFARDTGVDISLVVGTGPAGRITTEDVRDHQKSEAGSAATSRVPASGTAHAPAAAPGSPMRDADDVRIPFRGVRKKIAENLVRSKHTAAHYTYVEEIDCTDLVAVRQQANERLQSGGVKLSFLPFFIKATVSALRQFPALNAALDEAAGEIVQRRRYHIGLATATDAGLIVPVVRDADKKSLTDLALEIDRLAEATRSGKTSREDLTGSTFTITSLGALGGVMATPIINFPEVAILGIHKIMKRPAVVNNKIVIRDLMNLSISVDHRVVDGYDAARFVAAIKASLEAPGPLLQES